jgi:sialic acid synthase SpsE
MYKNTYIIAEIGINHNGNLNKAISLIKAAKKSGTDAVKFQLYNTNSLANKKDLKKYKLYLRQNFPLYKLILFFANLYVNTF